MKDRSEDKTVRIRMGAWPTRLAKQRAGQMEIETEMEHPTEDLVYRGYGPQGWNEERQRLLVTRYRFLSEPKGRVPSRLRALRFRERTIDLRRRIIRSIRRPFLAVERLLAPILVGPDGLMSDALWLFVLIIYFFLFDLIGGLAHLICLEELFPQILANTFLESI